MPKVSINTGGLQRQWLRRVIEETGLKPTPLAKASGLAGTTLNRFLDEPDDSPSTLSVRTVAKISEATGIAPPSAHIETAGRQVMRGLRDDGRPFNVTDRHDGKDLDAAATALGGKRNAVSAWTIRTSSLEDAGILPGDVVLVDQGRQPKAGNLVCAQVYDISGRAAETVFRFYEAPYLVASASRDRSVRKPLVVDNERVVVMGVVTHLMRALTTAA